VNNNLLILDAGQFSAVVEEIAVSARAFCKIDFLDDSASSRHIGKLDDYLHYKDGRKLSTTDFEKNYYIKGISSESNHIVIELEENQSLLFVTLGPSLS